MAHMQKHFALGESNTTGAAMEGREDLMSVARQCGRATGCANAPTVVKRAQQLVSRLELNLQRGHGYIFEQGEPVRINGSTLTFNGGTATVGIPPERMAEDVAMFPGATADTWTPSVSALVVLYAESTQASMCDSVLLSLSALTVNDCSWLRDVIEDVIRGEKDVEGDEALRSALGWHQAGRVRRIAGGLRTSRDVLSEEESLLRALEEPICEPPVETVLRGRGRRDVYSVNGKEDWGSDAGRVWRSLSSLCEGDALVWCKEENVACMGVCIPTVLSDRGQQVVLLSANDSALHIALQDNELSDMLTDVLAGMDMQQVTMRMSPDYAIRNMGWDTVLVSRLLWVLAALALLPETECGEAEKKAVGAINSFLDAAYNVDQSLVSCASWVRDAVAALLTQSWVGKGSEVYNLLSKLRNQADGFSRGHYVACSALYLHVDRADVSPVPESSEEKTTKWWREAMKKHTRAQCLLATERAGSLIVAIETPSEEADQVLNVFKDESKLSELLGGREDKWKHGKCCGYTSDAARPAIQAFHMYMVGLDRSCNREEAIKRAKCLHQMLRVWGDSNLIPNGVRIVRPGEEFNERTELLRGHVHWEKVSNELSEWATTVQTGVDDTDWQGLVVVAAFGTDSVERGITTVFTGMLSTGIKSVVVDTAPVS